MKNQTFTTLINGTDKEVMVRSPSLTDQREAQKVYNQAFTDAIKSKAVVRAKMEDVLTEQGLWDKEKQAKLSELQAELLDHERKLAQGGISLKEAKKIAMDMKELREDIRDLISVRTSLDNHSAEGQADNAKFNYLVSVCVVYNDNKEPVFKNMEDYLNRATENVAIVGAQNLANMIYGLDSNYESNLPENKFLKKYKFVDDQLRLIDNKGRLVDEEGRLIDETGRFINESGEFVDKFGNPVDKEGNYVVEFKPFLDDDGNPVSDGEVVAPVVESPQPVADVPAV
jgi:hypothetical protein